MLHTFRNTFLTIFKVFLGYIGFYFIINVLEKLIGIPGSLEGLFLIIVNNGFYICLMCLVFSFLMDISRLIRNH